MWVCRQTISGKFAPGSLVHQQVKVVGQIANLTGAI
jgi:hypothetical protein